MQTIASFKQLGELVLGEPDAGRVLQTIGLDALARTGGKVAMIALVDEDAGMMFIRCTVGEGWDDHKRGTELGVTVGSGEGITAYVAATGKPYISGDVMKDTHYKPMFANTKSEVAVPIYDGHGRVRGVLNVESDAYNAFTQEHVEALQALSPLIAIQLQLDSYAKRQEALVRIGTSLPISADEEALLEQVVEVTAALLRFEACSIFLLDEGSNQFVLRETHSKLRQKVNVATYEPGEGLTGWVGMHCKPIRIENPQTDDRWAGKHTELSNSEIGAFLAVPILTRDRCVGIIRVLRRKSENPWLKNEFTQDDEDVLTAIAGQLGAGLEGIRMLGRLLKSERMAAWGELSAKAAHMLGNSAFAIKGDINELLHMTNDIPDDLKDYREIAESLQTGIERLESILAEFRDFVMATQIHKQDLDINKLVLSSLEESFPKRSAIELELDLEEGLPTIQGDELKLRRSFGELVENVFHFQEQGKFLVQSELVPAEQVPENLALVRGRAYVRLEFEDQGPGVPLERKKQIFNPFHSSRVKGMGLGLSIVKGIIDAHEGVIFENGVPGEGARFVIYLPVRNNKNGKGSER